jgi:hypothetical protein
MMFRAPMNLMLGLGAGLLLVACGGDGDTTDGSAGATMGSSSTSTASSVTDPTTTTPTGGATDETVGASEAQSSTDEPSTGGTAGESTGSTGETTGMVVPDTSTGEDPSTSTTTTTGDDTSGTSGSSDSSGGDETGNEQTCPLAVMHLPCDEMSNDALHAFGLNCSSLGGKWIDKSTATAVAKLDFQAPPPVGGLRTWQVAKSYGTFIDPMTQKPFWSAREGDKMLMISSGGLPAPNGQGVITIADGDVYNDTGAGIWDSDNIPPPMSPAKGSPDPMGFKDCDGVGDCSNTIFDQWQLGEGNPEDKMWFNFELTAPALANGDMADANGYSFDFAMFSAEFPEYVGQSVNDMFIAWQSSEEYTGNVTFIDGQPLTITAVWPIDFQGECDFFDPQCVGQDEHLEGTGYISDGGATNWYKAIGGVKPGETFVLAFAIFDMGDSTFDTTALLDNWQWDCEGCIPSEVDSCGVFPQ